MGYVRVAERKRARRDLRRGAALLVAGHVVWLAGLWYAPGRAPAALLALGGGIAAMYYGGCLYSTARGLHWGWAIAILSLPFPIGLIVLLNVCAMPGIRLGEDRWSYIASHHPEITSDRQILRAIGNPDAIQEGDFGTLLAARSYPGDSPASAILPSGVVEVEVAGKYLVVTYREPSERQKGFVLMAHVAKGPLDRRRTIWNR